MILSFEGGGGTSKNIETPISHEKKRQPGKVGGKNCLRRRFWIAPYAC